MPIKYTGSRDMLLYSQYWYENVLLNEAFNRLDIPRSQLGLKIRGVFPFIMIAVVVYIVLRRKSGKTTQTSYISSYNGHLVMFLL